VIKTPAFVSDTIVQISHKHSSLFCSSVSNNCSKSFKYWHAIFHKHSSLFCHHVTYITEIVPDTDILVVDTKTQAYCLYVSVKDYKQGCRH